MYDYQDQHRIYVRILSSNKSNIDENNIDGDDGIVNNDENIRMLVCVTKHRMVQCKHKIRRCAFKKSGSDSKARYIKTDLQEFVIM